MPMITAADLTFTLGEDGDCFQSQPLALRYQLVQTFGVLILTYNPLAERLCACGAYPNARYALLGAGAKLIPVPVDSSGLHVAFGKRKAKNAKMAMVTRR